MSEIYDVVIIGGGPAGLSAAQYASRAKLKAIVLDKSKTAGALAYAHKIENYPGLTKPVSGKELLDMFREQAIRFGAEYIETQVVGVNFGEEIKEVFTMDNSYKSKTVIIATGSMGRKPTIKGEAEFLGKGVSYCAVCDAAFFKGKTVCVIGNSEEAVKEAGFLTKFASMVCLVSTTPKLKVDDDHPVFNSPNIKLFLGRSIVSIEGKDVVERIKTIDAEKKESAIELSGVFVYLQGSKPIVDFLAGAVEVNEEGCIITDRIMETSVPAVFAAGDVICKDVRQVVAAASDGCISALSAEQYITKRKTKKVDWGV
ncbi:MAG: FAD-dependent oxidoreductase [Nitrospiraceae bacterium]|nr:FAD-dependent oxidoreductase [Nitrospiraceae bacterium]